MSENNKFCNDKVVKYSNKGTKKLEKVPCNNYNKPKVKELHFIKEPQLLPIFIPINMCLHFWLFDNSLMPLNFFFIGHVISRYRIHLFPRKNQTYRADNENCQMYGHQWLLARHCSIVDSTCEGIRFQWTINVGKTFKRVPNRNGPVQTRIEFVIFINRNVRNNITNF